MSAIAGYVGRGGPLEPARACREMLRALIAFGPDAQDIKGDEDVALGRNLYKVLPEDDFDRQPLSGGGGRYLLVADVRIDNRAELAENLGIGSAEAWAKSDADLLLAILEKQGLESLDAILGDYAFGLWDFHNSSLILARSPYAVKPLFYHTNPRFTAFASGPAGLHALHTLPKEPDFAHAAAVAAQFTYLGSSTIFKNVKSVRHGHAVRLSGDREDLIRISDDRGGLAFQDVADYGDALRSELERAVGVRLRRHRGGAASQLSSGRDSSAVTTTAARSLAGSGERLLALTGAPRGGFASTSILGRLADESALASKTAAAHSNIDHLVCRTSGKSDPLAYLRALNELHHGPMLNPSNLSWWWDVNEQAASHEASVLLFASSGNFTISAGGIDQFGDAISGKGLFAGLSLALRMARSPSSSWRAVANFSLGPHLPRFAYMLLLRAAGRWNRDATEVPVLRAPHRSDAEQLLEQEFRDLRPPKSFFDYRRRMLERRDNPEQMSLARWGIDPRDPTSDRRLVELCFSVPPEQLISPRSSRPVFEAAFRDRIPNEVLTNTSRGYQGADWFEVFRKEEVKACFYAYGRNGIVRDLLDLDYIGGLIDAWPTAGWDRLPVIYTYRNKVLGALALASYLDSHFPD